MDCGSAATLLRTDVAERWGLLDRGAAIAGPGTPNTETVDLRGFDGKKKTVHLRRVSGHITVCGGAPVHVRALVLDQLAHPMLIGRDWFGQVALTNQGKGEWSSGIHRYKRLVDSTARRPAAPAPRPPTPAATPTPPPPAGPSPGPSPAEAIDIHLCSTADLETMLEAGEVESIALLSNVLDTVDSSLPTDAIVIDAALSELGAVKTDAAGVVHRAYELAKRTVPQLDVLAENDRSQKQRANTSRLRSGFTPAFLHFGRELNGVATLETRDLDYSAFPTPNDYARNLHAKLGAAFRDQRAALEKYRARREAHRRTHPNQIFEVGDLVYIKRARSGQHVDKTAPVYENTPVRVLERLRRPNNGEYLDTYRLDLPSTDQRHNAWPAQYLKKHVPSDTALWPDRRAEAAAEIAEDDEILEIRHRDLRFIPPTYVLRTKASPGFVERVEHEIPDKLLLDHLNEHGVTDLNRPSDTEIAAGKYPRVWGHLALLERGVVPKYKAVAGEWRLTQAHNNRLYKATGHKVVY